MPCGLGLQGIFWHGTSTLCMEVSPSELVGGVLFSEMGNKHFEGTISLINFRQFP